MFPNIEYHEAAFKHGVTEANIRYALWHPLHEQLLDAYKNKWLVVGYDTAGNLIEVAYNLIDDDTAMVFHAMSCRKNFLNELTL
jgi:uncharacterized DUF497 family protein